MMTERAHERMCMKWSAEETACLLAAIQMNRTVAEIAVEHRRSEMAIRHRLRKIAVDLFKAGVSVELLSSMTSLPSDEVCQAIVVRWPGQRAARRAARAAAKS